MMDNEHYSGPTPLDDDFPLEMHPLAIEHLQMAIERARALDRAADAPAWIAVELLAEVKRLQVIERNAMDMAQGKVRSFPSRTSGRRDVAADAANWILTGGA